MPTSKAMKARYQLTCHAAAHARDGVNCGGGFREKEEGLDPGTYPGSKTAKFNWLHGGGKRRLKS